MIYSFTEKVPLRLLTIGVLVCLISLYVPVAAAAFKNVMVGDQAPPLKLQDLDRGEYEVPDYGDSTAVLIVFWATWSSRSVMEMEDLAKLEEKYAEKGLKILAINVEKQAIGAQEISKINNIIEEKGLKFDVAVDEGLKTYNEWGVIATPTAALMDSTSVIVFEISGYPTSGYNDLDEAIQRALGLAPEEEKVASGKPAYQPVSEAIRHFAMGKRLLSKGFLTKAIPEFEKSAVADTHYADPRIYLGYAYIKAGTEEEASAPLENAMELDPARSEPVLLLAHLLVKKGQLDEALAFLEGQTALLGEEATEGVEKIEEKPLTGINLRTVRDLQDEGKSDEASEALASAIGEELDKFGISILKKKKVNSIMEKMKLMMEKKEQQ